MFLKSKTEYKTSGFCFVDTEQTKMTQLKLYPLLSTCSKRALRRTKKRWGHRYDYRPMPTLLNRLSVETGMTKEMVRDQLMQEREYILKYKQYY